MAQNLEYLTGIKYLSDKITEKAIMDIIQDILLKLMLHKLLFINNISKKAYLVERQNILKYYNIEKKQQRPSNCTLE
jgi:hypothetical protein|tara:strand:- start:436 stop:666 length:231 start_codon:yes stop_codon:yes gene_type:complete